MKIVDSIFPYLGINAVLEDTEINKIYRDLQTASHHGLIVSYRD
jgi:indole-3-acetate monooxygenase